MIKPKEAMASANIREALASANIREASARSNPESQHPLTQEELRQKRVAYFSSTAVTCTPPS
jgi:hypothetical protein